MSAAAEQLDSLPMPPPEAAWIQAFPGEPGGVDPRYGDRFPQAKEAIEQLSGTDFARVRSLCDEILTLESKDLRVLGYLALATLYERGVEGLLPVVEAYRVLVAEHWEHLHPRRPAARAAALEWLGNARFAAFFERSRDCEQLPMLETLLARIEGLNAALGARGADVPVVWTELRQMADTRVKKLRAAAMPVVPAPAASAPAAARFGEPVPASPSAGSSAGRSGIGSEAEFNQTVRDLHAYLRQNNDWLRLVSMARALRWGLASAPPAEDGRTRVPAPRAAALAAVEAAAGQGAWQDALIACENAFMEPGGQFCLALQQRAAEAAERIGRADVAALVGHLTAALLGRLPQLAELRFEDGTPFADGRCQAWLDQQRRPADGAPAIAVDDGALAEHEREARDRAAAEGLAQGLAVLDRCPAPDGRRRAAVALAKARLCLEQGRAELALPALEVLAERLEAAGVSDWEPGFMLQVWQALQRALKSADSGKDKARLEALRQKVCRADLTVAAHLL